jgi:hypothetical protein
VVFVAGACCAGVAFCAVAVRQQDVTTVTYKAKVFISVSIAKRK